jgi:SAM-dependent methyltransferase
MEEQKEKCEWFEEWFNTPFYHILYKNRNLDEAQLFVQNLVRYLQLAPSQHVLDLACGKGRHSIYLNQLGMRVTGADLSANSIAEAKKFENDRLDFLVHDMRFPIAERHFDVVVNLFTSFGYFDQQADNEQVLKSIHQMLVPNGKLVIDFFNLHSVLKNMKAFEIKTIDGIEFNISKRFDGNHIYKQIDFVDAGKNYSFTERVQGMDVDQFNHLLKQAGFEVQAVFGDFQLRPFDQEHSDRVILIAQKV